MDDRLNTVAVLRGHLVDLERTLAFVEGLLVSHDLTVEYRNMAAVTRPSRLTQDVQMQRERVSGYLAMEGDDVLEE
jgi:hypothetical protein